MRKLLMVGLILATFLLLNGNASAAPLQLQSGGAVSLQETAVAGAPTGVAAVELFLDPAFPGAGYANVVIDLDGDGLEPSTDDWWVQNFPAVLEPTAGPKDNIAFTFDVGALAPVGFLDVYASFTSSPVVTPSPGSMVLTPGLPFGLYDIGDLLEGTSAGLDGGIPSALGDTSLLADGPSAGIAPAADNALLAQQVIGRTRYDIPGIKQGKMECAPTAAAQSLLWLKKRYGLTGLPAQADLVDRLKKAMSPGWTAGDYPGINPANFVPGKNQVINNIYIKSPLTTKKGGADDGTGTFGFIKQEIEAGEDVEMRIQYHPTPPWGGHWVTVAGWYDDSTTKKLCFKDPATGGNTVDCYTVDGTTIKDYKYAPPGVTRAAISFAVSESIIPAGGITEVLVDGSDAPASAADGSSSSSPPYAAIAGGLAAAALALVAGGWYARRRWVG